MNITMLHDLDTGFMAATLKPAFQKLGHNCTVLQTLTTYLEQDASHIDILLSSITTEEQVKQVQQILKDTDYFLLRSLSDTTLRTLGVTEYANKSNTIWRIHGSELREKQVPYSLRTWRINWHNKEPVIVAPRDPSLFKHYRSNVITHIERPCNFSIFPKKKQEQPPFAITTPSNMERKGTNSFFDTWKSSIPLHIVHGVSRKQALAEKAKASFYIDNIGTYAHGPYGMNSVEAWYYKIPVFSNYNPIDIAIEPMLEDYIIHSTSTTIQEQIEQYSEDRTTLNKAYSYAITTHDPVRIAQQYISLFSSLSSFM